MRLRVPPSVFVKASVVLRVPPSVFVKAPVTVLTQEVALES